ncbi:hypothetical protein TWF730_008366 [Orbilia blumenaviensis]|uniref:RBR-type E3 ubiquitin transferase n=1 Tax=Orbilia blumenaviensis TaxID=1796055 RepID=A0AAV9V297_9PEZI
MSGPFSLSSEIRRIVGSVITYAYQYLITYLLETLYISSAPIYSEIRSATPTIKVINMASASIAGPSRSRLPEPTPSYDDDFMVALSLQLSELEFEQDSRKGKEKAGAISDRHLALQDYRDLLISMNQIEMDQRMAKSIADAVLQDAATIAEFVAVETAAARDREHVLRMENIIPQTAYPSASPSPRPWSRSAGNRDTDDLESLSAFTDYETQTNFPGYIVADELESRQGTPSVHPQERGMKYYTGPRVTCSICFNTVSQGHSAKCPCNHIYCTDCLRSYAFRAMKDESLYPLKCCKLEVPGEVIASILTASEYRQYEQAAVEYSTTNRIYCPNKSCLQFITPDSVSEIRNFAICTSCSTIACTRCKDFWHAGACPVDEELEAVIRAAGQEGWRQCYNCKRMIELSRGCHHMTCHCKAEFCYVCGVEWKNCTCELFEEQRLYNDAAARVDDAAVEPLAPAVRVNRIIEVQEQIRRNHACEHPGRFERRTDWKRSGHRCELCNARHWKYILACRHCGVQVCEECRRFRI